MKRKMINMLRKFSYIFHTPRTLAKEEAKVKIPMRKKDGTLGKRYTVAWKCAHCGELTTKPQLDHITPIGREPDYPYEIDELLLYMKKLLAPYSEWQVLCRVCHRKKTNKERAG